MYTRMKPSQNRTIFTRCMMLLFAAVLVAGSVLPAGSAAAPAKSSCGTGCTRYDVVVIGSEIQGVLLAKAARDLGLKVIILDPRSKPGGELIQGQMLVLDQPNDNQRRSLVQGEIRRLFNGYNAGTIRKEEEFNRYFQSVSKNIPIQNSIRIEAVDVVPRGKEKAIRSLTYRTKEGKQYKAEAEYFVENTDFNALTSKLEVKRIPGMESIYNGKKTDHMAATLMLRFKNVDWNELHQHVLLDYPLTNVQKKYGPNTYVDWNTATGFSNLTFQYKPKDDQLTFRGINSTYQRNGQVIMNALLIFNVDPANPESVRSAVEKGKAEAPHILKFLQEHIPGYKNAELDGFPYYLYIRDYNRFETDYILDYPDVMSGKMFWDNVSIGGYTVDLQAVRAIPKGIGFGKPNPYGMPLRSFQLKSYENVLVVGKNVGATIKAYGTARIMPNTALAAETIGIILGKELKHKRLKQLTQADFQRIHKYLERSYGIVLNR